MADPARLIRNMNKLTAFMPQQVAAFITMRMFEGLETSDGLKGMGLAYALFGFGAYAKDVGHYSVTCGSLSAPIVLRAWFYLLVYALLLGAELDSGT